MKTSLNRMSVCSAINFDIFFTFSSVCSSDLGRPAKRILCFVLIKDILFRIEF